MAAGSIKGKGKENKPPKTTETKRLSCQNFPDTGRPFFFIYLDVAGAFAGAGKRRNRFRHATGIL